MKTSRRLIATLLVLAATALHAGVITTIQYNSVYNVPGLEDLDFNSATASSGGLLEFDAVDGNTDNTGSSIASARNQGRALIEGDLARFSSNDNISGNAQAAAAMTATQVITYEGSGVGNATWGAQILPGGFGLTAGDFSVLSEVTSLAGFTVDILLEEADGTVNSLFSASGQLNSDGTFSSLNVLDPTGFGGTRTTSIGSDIVLWGESLIELDLGLFSAADPTKTLIYDISTFAISTTTCGSTSLDLCQTAFASFGDPPTGGYGSVMFLLISSDDFFEVPEPSTLGLLFIGLLGLQFTRRKQRG